jgi:hypothetical protein
MNGTDAAASAAPPAALVAANSIFLRCGSETGSGAGPVASKSSNVSSMISPQIPSRC